MKKKKVRSWKGLFLIHCKRNVCLHRKDKKDSNFSKGDFSKTHTEDRIQQRRRLNNQIIDLQRLNRELSGELLNKNEEINMLEEEIDRLKSANEDLKAVDEMGNPAGAEDDECKLPDTIDKGELQDEIILPLKALIRRIQKEAEKYEAE